MKKGVRISDHEFAPLFQKLPRFNEAGYDLKPKGDMKKNNTVIKYKAKKRDGSANLMPVMPDHPLMLSCSELMDKILYALDNRQPLSVVSVGATEAFVMAQYTIYPEAEFMNHGEAYNANLGIQSGFFHRGIRFPNIEARNEAVAAVKQADIVGYNTLVDDARKLAEQVFSVYNMDPRYVFEANLRRVFMFSQAEKFEQILKNRRILLIGSLEADAEKALNQKLKEKVRKVMKILITTGDFKKMS